MSRIGKKPIPLLPQVQLSIAGNAVEVTGPKGRLVVDIPEGIQVERKEMLNRIKTCIDELPKKQKAVMQLRDIEGYSYNEISGILEIDLNQVKVNLFRARKSVRHELVKTDT